MHLGQAATRGCRRRARDRSWGSAGNEVTVVGAGNEGASRALRIAGEQLAGAVLVREGAALAKSASAVRELIDVLKRKIA